MISNSFEDYFNKLNNSTTGLCTVDFSDNRLVLDMDSEFAEYIEHEAEKCIGIPFDLLLSDAGAEKYKEVLRNLKFYNENYVSLEFKKSNNQRINITIFVESKEKYIELHAVDTMKLIAMQNNIFTLMKLFPCGYLFYSAPHSDVEIDEHTFKFEFANDIFYQIIGYTPEQFSNIGYKLFAIVEHNSKVAAITAYKKAMLVPNYSFQCEHSIVAFDGSIIPVTSNLTRVVVGDTDYIVCVFIDVSQQKMMSQKLRYLTDRNNILTEIAEEIMFEYDVESGRFSLPDKHVNTFKVSPFNKDIYSGFLKDIMYKDDFERVLNKLKLARNTRISGTSEIRLILNNGDPCWFKVSYASMVDSYGDVYKVVGRLANINDLKKEQEEAVKKLLLDPMTLLLNKTAVKMKADEFFKEDKRALNKEHACLVVDIDNFKHVNDTLGHMFGDVIIENVANVIKANIREDDLAGRVGGDEFVVILKNIDKKTAYNRAETIAKEVSRIYSGEHKDIKISSSIGISFYGDEHGKDYETLFKKADTAMYVSKNSGKGMVTIFDSAHHALIDDKLSLDDDKIKATTIEYDKPFIQYAYSLFLNTKDYDSTINVLLSRIGKKYGFNRVTISKMSHEEGLLYTINCWDSKAGIVTNDLPIRDFSSWQGFYQSDNGTEVQIVDDCSDENIAYGDRKVFESLGLKALINCRIVKRELNADYVFVFLDMENTRNISDFDKETIFQFCQTMTLFITVRNESLRNTNHAEQAYLYDRLTGVYNFDAFMVRSSKVIREYCNSNYVLLMYSDIEGFASFNDNIGYVTGDSVLKHYASFICDEENVKLVCRIHSDLFLNLIVAASKEEAITTVNKIRNRYISYINETFPIRDSNLNIGLYHIVNGNMDMAVAFDCVNQAKKSAKSSNNKDNLSYILYDELLEDTNASNDLLNDMNHAISMGDIQIYLQPQFDIRNKKLIGIESLARWKGLDGSVILPDLFIPVLEKNGNIVNLDFFNLEKALQILKKWKEDGKELVPLSINFSRKHNSTTEFVDRILMLVRKYDIDEEYIHIEVSEECLLDESRVMYNNLKKLQKLGFVIAIDNFGIVPASLEILLSAPVDIVKIDRHVLKKLDYGEINKEYIVKMCDLLKAANKIIIFEGIEKIEQVDFLKENQCYFGQGYYYEKPLTIENFESIYYLQSLY